MAALPLDQCKCPARHRLLCARQSWCIGSESCLEIVLHLLQLTEAAPDIAPDSCERDHWRSPTFDCAWPCQTGYLSLMPVQVLLYTPVVAVTYLSQREGLVT